MKKSVFDQVLEDFLTDIFSNHFRPGEILSERMLTEAYGCSKTTMREVLVTLCNSRILRSIPRMGYEVLLVAHQEAKDTMEYRRILEVGYLRQHFHRITPEVIQRLKDCNRRCRDMDFSDGLGSHWDANAEFHMELFRAVGSAYAEWNLQFVMGIQKRACLQYLTKKYDAKLAAMSMVNHDAIIAAMEAGDVEGACKALHDDLCVFIKE